jgi:hypothetical protein
VESMNSTHNIYNRFQFIGTAISSKKKEKDKEKEKKINEK